MSRVSRHSQETFTFACGIVENFLSYRPQEFSEQLNPEM